MITPQHNPTFDHWLLATDEAIAALLTFRSYLRAWPSHPLLGYIDPMLFDAILLDMEKGGVGCIVNEKSTRRLREIVTGVEQ